MEKTVRSHEKFLCVQKILFMVFCIIDFFHLSEITYQKYVSRLAWDLVNCPILMDVFLRRLTKSNAHKSCKDVGFTKCDNPLLEEFNLKFVVFKMYS